MATPFVDAPPAPVKTNLSGSWFTDSLTSHELHQHHMKRTLVETRTPFQNVILADSYSFGRCLVLDGEIQSAQRDEFIYHECLVQPAMVLHKNPREVLVLGGGEGATLREILRHSGVKRVTMVDIDGQVVDFCKKYLKEWHQGTLSHPKTRLVIGDARDFIMNSLETFDVIIADLPTPSTLRGPVYELYTLEFYRDMLKRLRPGGLLMVQAGSGHLLQLNFHAMLFKTLQKIFKVVRPCYAFVPSFDVPWAFLLCTGQADPLHLTAKTVDQRLGTIGRKLRFYDGQMHEGLFRIPKYVRETLAKQKKVLRRSTGRS
jgi:spermidine synthase